LWSVDVDSGIEKKFVTLDIPPRNTLAHLSLHPDGKRFLTTVETEASDLWIMDGVTAK
jgi:hypothetical protein